MKIELKNKENILFNDENGIKIKGIYPLNKFENGKKLDEVEGVSLKILSDSEVFFDLDYVYLKIKGRYLEDFDGLDLSKFYKLKFKNLRGNIYNGKNGINLSLEADDIDIQGAK